MEVLICYHMSYVENYGGSNLPCSSLGKELDMNTAGKRLKDLI